MLKLSARKQTIRTHSPTNPKIVKPVRYQERPMQHCSMGSNRGCSFRSKLLPEASLPCIHREIAKESHGHETEREQKGEGEREIQTTNERTKTQGNAENRAISEGVILKTTMIKIVKELTDGNHKEGRDIFFNDSNKKLKIIITTSQ